MSTWRLRIYIHACVCVREDTCKQIGQDFLSLWDLQHLQFEEEARHVCVCVCLWKVRSSSTVEKAGGIRRNEIMAVLAVAVGDPTTRWKSKERKGGEKMEKKKTPL